MAGWYSNGASVAASVNSVRKWSSASVLAIISARSALSAPLAEQVSHHAPARFHGALERTLDGGDETLGALDGTVDKLG